MSDLELRQIESIVQSAIKIFAGYTEITISDPYQTIIVRPKSFVKIIRKPAKLPK